MPTLLLLNGPPGIGKSTLASRMADERPLTLLLDLDDVRATITGWRDREEPKLLARDLAAAMAATHLAAGHDVVLPQLLARPDFVERLRGVAAAAGAQFVEVLLVAPKDVVVARFLERRAALLAAGAAHAEAEIPAGGEAAALEVIVAALAARAAADRTIHVVDAGGDAAAVAAKVLGLVARR